MSIPHIDPYPMPTREDLPDNVMSWTVDRRRAVLLVHDMQNYFVRCLPAGVSPTTDLIANVARLRDACAAAGVRVVYTAQPGRMSDEERGLLKDVWGPGMHDDGDDRNIVEELSPRPGDRVLTKWRYSALHHTPLLEIMRREERDQIIVCGVYAHVGCLMTACDAFSHDIQPFMVADAVADFSLAHHRLALAYAAQRCAAVVATDDVLAALTAGAVAGVRPG